jgi:hypothetical protein
MSTPSFPKTDAERAAAHKARMGRIPDPAEIRHEIREAHAAITVEGVSPVEYNVALDAIPMDLRGAIFASGVYNALMWITGHSTTRPMLVEPGEPGEPA